MANFTREKWKLNYIEVTFFTHKTGKKSKSQIGHPIDKNVEKNFSTREWQQQELTQVPWKGIWQYQTKLHMQLSSHPSQQTHF